MKSFILSMAVLFTSFGVFAQSTIGEGGPKIEFEKDVHDFGNLMQNGDATYVFKFTNTGDAPLIIAETKGSCGCTVPKKAEEFKPILPGETAELPVKYDSKRVGPINKSVTIKSNATNEPSKVIRIKGSIAAAPAEETSPVKKSSVTAPVEK